MDRGAGGVTECYRVILAATCLRTEPVRDRHSGRPSAACSVDGHMKWLAIIAAVVAGLLLWNWWAHPSYSYEVKE
jgi:hypothetical protein